MNEPAGGGEREPRSGVAFWQATGQRLTIYTADRLVERSAGGFSCDGAPSVSAWRFSRRTGWTQNLQTPLRRFLRTETGGAVVLLTATLAALAWANVDPAGMRRRGTRC